MIHFNNISGKNKGKLQITKLARFFGKTEGALRAVRKRNPKELEIIHMGCLCIANGIKECDIERMLSDAEINNEILD